VSCHGATSQRLVFAKPAILVEFGDIFERDGFDGKIFGEPPETFGKPNVPSILC
jgi:hypothetical protein